MIKACEIAHAEMYLTDCSSIVLYNGTSLQLFRICQAQAQVQDCKKTELILKLFATRGFMKSEILLCALFFL